jgi:hypothetical protein
MKTSLRGKSATSCLDTASWGLFLHWSAGALARTAPRAQGFSKHVRPRIQSGSSRFALIAGEGARAPSNS